MANVYDFNTDDSDSSDFGGFGVQPNSVPVRNNDQMSDASSVRTADLSDFDDDQLGSGSDIEVSSNSDDSEDDDFDFDNIQVDWTDNNFQIVQRHYFNNQQSGPNLPQGFDTKSTPIGYFHLFFTEELIRNITKDTNNYAEYCIQGKRRDNHDYKDRLWQQDITFEEMRAYLGLLILFGVSPRPQYKDYWSTDIYIGNQGVKEVMSLKRFEKISQYFHVSDRSSEPARDSPQYDKLFKIRPVMLCVEKNCKTLYSPNEHQAIDEGMIGYKGREKHVQYMPAKPVKRGIKIFCRCDSNTGYLHEMEIYLGKANTAPTQRGVYFDVVDRLTKNIQGKHHRLFFDNLYTGVPLVLYLLEKQIYSTGTIRQNRKFIPGQWPTGKFSRGEHKALQDKNNPHLTLTAWQDTKMVRVCSSAISPHRVTHCIRRVKAVLQRVTQPLVLAHYNRHYGGVDRFDQRRAKYRIGRFSRKSWKYLFHFYVNTSIINAWLLYSETSTREKPFRRYEQLHFRTELLKELIGGFSIKQNPRVKPPVFGPNAEPNVLNHENVHMEARRVRQCIAHSRFQPNGKPRKQTAFGCRACNVHICKDCHNLFHQVP